MKKFLLLILIIFSFNITNSIEYRQLLFTDMFTTIETTEDIELIRQRNYLESTLQGDLFDYYAEYKVTLALFFDNYAVDKTTPLFNMIKEFYFSLYPEWGDIHIGNRLITLGKTDVYSPLNRYNASYNNLLSLDDPYQSKLSQISLESIYYLNDDSALSLIYIPITRANYQTDNIRDIESLSKTIIENSDYFIEDEYNSIFLSYTYYSFYYDIQLLYGNFISPMANYYNTGSEITLQYNREQLIGVSFSTSIGDLGLVNELAFNYTDNFSGNDIGIKRSDITNNLQLSSTLWLETYAQLNMIYQYLFQYSDVTEFEIAVNDIFNQPQQNILFFIGHLHNYFLREKLYVGLNLGFFFSSDIYIAPRLNYSLSDNLTFESGLNIFTEDYSPKTLARDSGGDNIFFRVKYEL